VIACILSVFAPQIIGMISTEAFVHTTVMGYSAVDAMQIVAWIFLVYFISSLYTYVLIAQ
jgi:O-antigen/teichoic acid export membrane protein